MTSQSEVEVDEKISKTYKTKDGQSVEVVYDEFLNDWQFKIDKRTRSRASLAEAKSVILNYKKTEREVREKVKFEPFGALWVEDLSYRLPSGKSIAKEMKIVGLKESCAGSGSFEVVTVEFEGGSKLQVSLRGNKEKKKLVFKSSVNDQALAAFEKKILGLQSERILLEEKIRVLENQNSKLDEQYKSAKELFVNVLEPIEVMDEFDWNVMSMREKAKSSSEVAEIAANGGDESVR